MCVPIFKQIASLLAWVERWKVRDFVCKKVGIEWDWELSGELRYLGGETVKLHVLERQVLPLEL